MGTYVPNQDRRLGSPHIPALDGLRALAVLGVLAFHDNRLSGGFLGVDLFFVLSGFLITSLLIERSRRSEPLWSFWTQRLRRLTPAVVVLIVIVLVVFRCTTDPSEWILARRDAPWAQFYGANWHQIFLGTDYWDQFSTPSPFEHLWSLAIEEQFYLLWPIIVIALMKWKRENAVTVACGLGAVISAVIMWWLVDDSNPTRVYMGTDTRAFSLLIGGLLATPIVRQRLAIIVRRSQPLMTSVALVLAVAVGAMWVTARGDDIWLFPAGLLGHAGAAGLIIVIVAHTSSRLTRVLASRPLTYIGRLSYSLYLWHWPVDIYLSSQRARLDGLPLSGVRLAVTVALAAASYHLIEYPIRYRARWAHTRRALGVFVLAMALTAITWLVIPIPHSTNAVNANALATFVTTVPPTTSPIETPDVVPTWSDLDLRSAYFFGDSIASDLWPAVHAALSAAGITVESGAFGGVGLVASADNIDPLATLADRLDTAHPDLLIIELSVWDADQPGRQQLEALTTLKAMAEARGLHVLLMSFPSLEPSRTQPGQALLEMRARDLARSSNGKIAYLDQRPALGSTFTFDVDGDGVPERKRDGIHVCPTGALIVAQWLSSTLHRLVPTFTPEVSTTWAYGDWRLDDRYDSPPGACARL